jgi:hypothetical protein
MDCTQCGEGYNTFEIYREEVPCGHCGGLNIITYEICKECGTLFRICNGEVVDEGTSITALDNEALPVGELEELLKNMANHVERTVKESPESMNDMVHRCLKCNALAFETGKGKFECSDCEFCWEVVEVV